MDGVLTLYGTPEPLYPLGRNGSQDGETYGGDVCAPYDQHLPPYCADDSGKPVVGAEEWCGKAWCWVDQDNCAVANTNFESNFPLTKMHWSYETCGDGAIATVPIPSIQAPQSCDDEMRTSCADATARMCFLKQHPLTSCSADGKREWAGILSHCAGLPAAACASCYPESKCSAGGDSKSKCIFGGGGKQMGSTRFCSLQNVSPCFLDDMYTCSADGEPEWGGPVSNCAAMIKALGCDDCGNKCGAKGDTQAIATTVPGWCLPNTYSQPFSSTTNGCRTATAACFDKAAYTCSADGDPIWPEGSACANVQPYCSACYPKTGSVCEGKRSDRGVPKPTCTQAAKDVGCLDMKHRKGCFAESAYTCFADGRRKWGNETSSPRDLLAGKAGMCPVAPVECGSCFPNKCDPGYTPIVPAAGLPKAWYDCSYKGFKSCDDNSVCSSNGGKTPCDPKRYVASCTTSKATYCGTASGSWSGSWSGS